MQMHEDRILSQFPVTSDGEVNELFISDFFGWIEIPILISFLMFVSLCLLRNAVGGFAMLSSSIRS
jgi:hypothetical protein